MVRFDSVILKFNQQGEKSGWTYLEIPAHVSELINPNTKVSYRVKGKLDNYVLQRVSLLPLGGGSFVLPLNATIRKHIKKGQGEILKVELTLDTSPFELSSDLLACLNDAPGASLFFEQLAPSHQQYFSKWIESAKTEGTKAKRIEQTILACEMKIGYGEMIKWFREEEKKKR